MRYGLQALVGLTFGAVIAFGPAAFAQNNVAGNSEAQISGSAQVAQPDQGGVNWKGVGVGAGTVAGNILYVPAKLVYGILGGIAGGAGYALTGGNQQVSDTIWRSSLGGDYVLTPGMITGKEPVHFSGPTRTASTESPTGGDPAGNGLAFAPTGASAPPTAPHSSSVSSSSIPPAGSAAAVTHPIDSGAGPVSAAVPVAPTHKSASPDSSIE
jgi:hypothetical protein